MSKSVFLRLLKADHLPLPTEELVFAPPRKWRFDYAWPEQMVALEVEGGVWTQGRHTRGSGYVRDLDKYNTAACLGWRLLRVTPQQLTNLETVAMIRTALEA